MKGGELSTRGAGRQWRFSATAIGAWLKAQRGESPEPRRREPFTGVQRSEPSPESPRRDIATDFASLRLADLIPIATLQSIQDQAAVLAGWAAAVADYPWLLADP